MRDNYQAWAKSAGWEVEGDGFWVQVGSRRQLLTVVNESGVAVIRSRVARKAVLNRAGDAERRAWQRNRVSELVGFRVDSRGVMVAETPIPADAGIDEWTYLAFNLARAADRFECVLSGKDEE